LPVSVVELADSSGGEFAVLERVEVAVDRGCDLGDVGRARMAVMRPVTVSPPTMDGAIRRLDILVFLGFLDGKMST
jgi:hypothetical protein